MAAIVAPGCRGRDRQPGVAQAPGRPNVLVVLLDDLRSDTPGYAGKGYVKTPQIDRIAAEGVNFRNAFATTSLCSPSRASLLTGVYAHRHGVTNNFTELPAALETFPEGAAAVRVHDGLRRQVAHGREQRRAAARLRLLRHPQGAGQVLRHRVQLQRREARGQARLLHDRGHRHRARLAAARSPAEAVDDDPRPQGDAQLLHAGKDVRARVRQRAGQLPRIRVLAGRQAGLGEGSPLHVARHLRPALRMAQEISRRSAGGGEGLREHGARLPGDAAERRRQRRPAARVARTDQAAGQHDRRLRRRQRAARGRARHGRQADDARAEHQDSAGGALPGADAQRPRRSTSRC